MKHRAYLGLGANLGDRLGAMRAAVARIEQVGGCVVTARSNLYETAPMGGLPGQPDYLNAVVRLETRQAPHDLLVRCLEIEHLLGRVRTIRYGPRTIDIDLLLYNEVIIDTPDLVLPHPRLHVRRFVLQPLADIGPELRHPILGATIRELLDRLPESDGSSVRRVDDADWALPHRHLP
ncbi:MAG: 2-amino-4-hydroxy-6-hydroxymethyldihydropteridine diphosphokinase [Planctomycetota bacterium]